MRANRSWLYVPGDRPERFSKALASGADAVILDLEDSVAAGAREAAIVHVDAFLAAHAVGAAGAAQVWVRVNDAVVRHPGVAALSKHASLDGFVIPKFETPDQCAGWGKPVLALIETPRGVVDAGRITALAAADLHGIALGPEDLSTALGVNPTLESMAYASSVVVMAAHAAGVMACACPGSIGEFRDLAAWRATLDAGRRLGSHGSLCIHPAQVAPANEAFSPTPAELEWARRVAAAWEAAAGQGAVALDGTMLDLPVVQRARNTLARAGALPLHRCSAATPRPTPSPAPPETPMTLDSRLPDFRSLTPAQRLEQVASAASLSADDIALLAKPGALPLALADGMIENVVGTFELPFGIAANFRVNGRDVLVPMVVEEPSVVAAASFMAKLARDCGGFETSSSMPLMRAQVQVLGVTDPYGARQALLRSRAQIIEIANSRDKVLIGLGGGCRDIEVHVFPETPRGAMVVMHLLVDVRDAMGANTVNTMAESVSPLVEKVTGGSVRLRILSNLADLRTARARVRITPDLLETKERSGAEVVEGILDAYTLAVIDPYRAATHNKGIMNGVDPVIVATGNDWRAVEAGAHAFASRSGRYTSLTRWEKDKGGALVGSIEMPMPVGLVGGATKTHPLARLALKILDVKSAQELGEIAVAVGLAQNLGALRALATEGIQRGHMALHARNMALVAGAVGDEVDRVAKSMAQEKDVRIDRAIALLKEMRGQ